MGLKQKGGKKQSQFGMAALYSVLVPCNVSRTKSMHQVCSGHPDILLNQLWGIIILNGYWIFHHNFLTSQRFVSPGMLYSTKKVYDFRDDIKSYGKFSIFSELKIAETSPLPPSIFRGRPLMIWAGGGQRKSRKKNYGGHSSGKKNLKGHPPGKKSQMSYFRGKNLKPLLREFFFRDISPREKKFKHFFDWVW